MNNSSLNRYLSFITFTCVWNLHTPLLLEFPRGYAYYLLRRINRSDRSMVGFGTPTTYLNVSTSAANTIIHKHRHSPDKVSEKPKPITVAFKMNGVLEKYFISHEPRLRRRIVATRVLVPGEFHRVQGFLRPPVTSFKSVAHSISPRSAITERNMKVGRHDFGIQLSARLPPMGTRSGPVVSCRVPRRAPRRAKPGTWHVPRGV